MKRRKIVKKISMEDYKEIYDEVTEVTIYEGNFATITTDEAGLILLSTVLKDHIKEEKNKITQKLKDIEKHIKNKEILKKLSASHLFMLLATDPEKFKKITGTNSEEVLKVIEKQLKEISAIEIPLEKLEIIKKAIDLAIPP